MSGEPDPQYSLARRALLDGLAALAPHLDSIVVIGAQAVYLHTGPADLAIAEFTTDADLAIGPQFLATDIGGLMRAQGFHMHDNRGCGGHPTGSRSTCCARDTGRARSTVGRAAWPRPSRVASRQGHRGGTRRSRLGDRPRA